MRDRLWGPSYRRALALIESLEGSVGLEADRAGHLRAVARSAEAESWRKLPNQIGRDPEATDDVGQGADRCSSSGQSLGRREIFRKRIEPEQTEGHKVNRRVDERIAVAIRG